MKKCLSLFTLTFALMFAVTVKVNAAEITVTDDATLRSCVSGNNVCKLSNDIDLTAPIEIADGQEVTIILGTDLATIKITAPVSVTRLFKVTNGSLTVNGKGLIKGHERIFNVLGNQTTGGSTIKSELKIGSDVEVESDIEHGVLLAGKGAKLDLYGSIKTEATDKAAIQGNGTYNVSVDNGNTVINIYDGAKVISENDVAIYHPQNGELNVYGGTITGTTGIEMRAGKLVVKGGTITGTAVPTSTTSNGKGSTTTGAGIAIIQHTTGLDLTAEIIGGTVKGYTAFYHNNTQNNSEEATNRVKLNIKGGTFETINNGVNAIYSDTKENFVKGGKFIGTVEEEFIDSNLETKVIDGVTYVGTSIPEETTPNEPAVVIPENPNTLDNVGLFILLGLISLVAFGYTLNKLRKNA